MPGRPSVKDEELYEQLREEGNSKEQASAPRKSASRAGPTWTRTSWSPRCGTTEAGSP